MTFKHIIILLTGFSNFIFAQYNLDYFINKAENNSPAIKDYTNQYLINNLQKKLDVAQNSAFQVYLSGGYLFVPYFNNDGVLITSNPGSNAIGYDAGLTNGGLYSAQINVQKNIFNGVLLDALNDQKLIHGKSYENKSNEEKHNVQKQVTDLYLNTLQYLLLYNASSEIKNNLNDQLNISGDLVARGFLKAQDYLLLKIEFKSQQIDEEQTWQNYKSSLSQLYSYCGIKDTQTVMIDSVNLNLLPSVSGSNFLTQYYLDSLDAENQQKIFEAKYSPQVSLFFNAGLNAVEVNDIQRKFGLSAGINFSMPILDGNQKDITRQQSYLSEQTLLQYKDYLAGNISAKRTDSGSRIKSLKKNLDDLNSQIGDYKKLLNISERQLQQGNLSMIDYLVLLKNYIDIRKNNITAEINYQLEISNYIYWNW
ncbi:MAG: TolC family protein [Ignavibacteriaceae bacterium]|nr:TolC family protein [Ignavibacteriaceae bacterium]